MSVTEDVIHLLMSLLNAAALRLPLLLDSPASLRSVVKA